ncbi:Ig-like domain-containing protein [Oerskovia douganii]|uniref:Ig-like domain-containing protein n=1 Tax=Oerskovia douganii TaxID=2762210 RepID=UPI002AB29D9D|nr:Ig-like domain-containing protein [Oerskovia douganii]
MTFLSRLHGKRRAIASVSTVSIFSTALVAFAITYDGQATADVELNDSGVWVTRTSGGVLGRFNSESQALDGSLLAGSASFDVRQSAGRVLLVDDGSGSASPVDVARLKLDGSVRPPVGATVAMGGSTVAILDGEEGLLWVMPFSSAQGFDPESTEPTAEVGDDGALQVAQDGTTYVAVPTTGRLTKVATSAGGEVQGVTTTDLPIDDGDDVEITTVGADVVVLDRTASRLVLPGGKSVPLADGSAARLQQPGAATADVAVATSSGLVLQPLGGGDAVTRAASGTPSPPVQLGGCTYGAWSQTGQVIRDCEGTDNDVDRRLDGVDPQNRLEYRVNRKAIVLNDLSAGTLWMAADEYEKVDDWELVLPEQSEGEESDAELTTPEQVDQFVLDRTQPNQPPQPQDDVFGMRPGRTTLLPVLGNDVDPDGDVMTATLAGRGPGNAEVQSVLGGAALQAVVPADAVKGRSSFRYSVSDGRGGTAEAGVQLQVSPWGENAAPVQTGEPVLVVEQGRSAQIKVLPYFRDPDGDDLYLAAASATSAGDDVRTRPDGTVEFRDGGTSTGRKTVKVMVADGQGEIYEGVLHVDVSGAGQLPPVAVADHVVVPAGQPVTVEPLHNDYDANGDELRLTTVAESAPAQITPNYDAGTFQFFSNEPRSYDLTYQVSDGPNATTGLVRVDVLPASAAEGAPIVVSDTALLPSGGSALVDVLANDTDPAGGVLVVQSVTVPDDAGVSVAVLAHQMLRITEIRRLDAPVTIEYKVSNGTQTTVGQVRVIPVPAPVKLQPPNAAPDEATVRVGDVVTIPVLRNDTHPDGLELFLQDEFEQGIDPEQGELFVSEGNVRPKAGSKPGTAYAIYRVRDKNGQEDSAQVTIHIRDGEENSAPRPLPVEMRVLTGASVRTAVPLDGIDPDGDSVQLTGIASSPSKGTATVEDGYIVYTASDRATGADSFSYSVQDARGEIATGAVRVGISRPPAKNQPPVAMDDTVTVRPARTVSVAALANDTDPDGDQIALRPAGLEADDSFEAEVVGDRVVLTSPAEAGTSSFYYGIEDAPGARAAASITVKVDQEAPLLSPVARDDSVQVGSILGRTSVDVPVLDNDDDPDGAATELTVTTDAPGVRVGADGVLSIALTQERQVITYTVTDVDGLTSKAFVKVPGLTEQVPQLRPGIAPLEVYAGESLQVDITDYVLVLEGRTPRLTDESKVSALEGTVAVTDATNVTYTPRVDYAGSAALSFEVTDGSGPEDPDGHEALLTLPIVVRAPKNLPPVLSAAAVDVAAGDEGAVDLARFVEDPDGDPVTFKVSGGVPAGISVAISGTTATVQATPEVPKGSVLPVPITATDGEHPPVEGVLTVTVVASTRPLAKANEDTVDKAHQGKAVEVDVLANDSNPFPETPLEVVSSSVETGSGTATVSGARVVATPDESFVGVMVVRYRVQDATGDPDRQVEGRIQVTVQGRPDTPSVPQVEEVRSKTVVLSWAPPVNNGADITGYTVRSADGYEKACATTTCTLDGLTNNVTYNFSVTATNEVGDSDPSPPSADARPDEKPDPPAPPTLAFGDQSLAITWVNATYTDRSAIESVNLEISPAPPGGAVQKTDVTGTQYVWTGLKNGVDYKVRVQAVNLAPDPSEFGGWSDGMVPAGKPAAPSAPRAQRSADSAINGGVIDVTWGALSAEQWNGDDTGTYWVQRFKGGAADGSALKVAGTSHRATGLDNAASYTFTITGENKAGVGEASAASNAQTPFARPEAPTDVRATDAQGVPQVAWNPPDDNGSPVTSYTVTASGGGGSKTVTGTSVAFTGLNAGSSYSFTVTATNEGGTSDASASSGEVPVYEAPTAPTVSWSRDGSGTDGYFAVGDPGSWQGNVGHVEWQLSGSESGSGTSAGRVDVGGGIRKSYTVQARACNAAGCSGWVSASGATYNPQATVSKGEYVSNNRCNDGTCYKFVVTTQEFVDTGNQTYVCNSDSPGNGSFSTGTVSFPTSGSVQLYCYLGSGNRGYSAWVTINGQSYQSNAVRW